MPLETYKIFNKERNTEEYKKIKNILHYVTKGNYELKFSNYTDIQQIIDDANVIRFYGNEPSVRRAIRLLNLDRKIKDNFTVVMSLKCKKRLQDIEDIKQLTKVKFKISKGPITIKFE